MALTGKDALDIIRGVRGFDTNSVPGLGKLPTIPKQGRENSSTTGSDVLVSADSSEEEGSYDEGESIRLTRDIYLDDPIGKGAYGSVWTGRKGETQRVIVKLQEIGTLSLFLDSEEDEFGTRLRDNFDSVAQEGLYSFLNEVISSQISDGEDICNRAVVCGTEFFFRVLDGILFGVIVFPYEKNNQTLADYIDNRQNRLARLFERAVTNPNERAPVLYRKELLGKEIGVFKKLFAAVQLLHDKAGMAHIDLKPDNVLLFERQQDPIGGVLIIDLGSTCVPDRDRRDFDAMYQSDYIIAVLRKSLEVETTAARPGGDTRRMLQRVGSFIKDTLLESLLSCENPVFTPEYAPVSIRKIRTRLDSFNADFYALGQILFELVTGSDIGRAYVRTTGENSGRVPPGWVPSRELSEQEYRGLVPSRVGRTIRMLWRGVRQSESLLDYRRNVLDLVSIS